MPEQLQALLQKMSEIDKTQALLQFAHNSEWMQASPIGKKLSQFLLEPGVREALTQVFQRPNPHQLAYYDMGFLFAVFILKHFALARLEIGQFLRRIMIMIFCMFLNFAGVLVIVPHFFFGPSYGVLLRAAYRVFSS